MDRLEELVAAAAAVRERAYVPYSHFQVGAALLGESGSVYVGCNVENISYGLSSCAERNAVFGAVTRGERRFTAVAVVTAAPVPTPPCGACRQVLAEFAHGGDMQVILATTSGEQRSFMLSQLLPESFSSFSADQDGG